MDKYAQQYEVRDQQTYLSRFRRDRRKEYVLTRGGLGIDSFSMSQEVSRDTKAIAARLDQLFQIRKYWQQTQNDRQLGSKSFAILYLDGLEETRAETEELDSSGSPKVAGLCM